MAGRNGNETQANECLKLMRDERKPTTSRLAVAVGLLRAADEETARDLGATNESLMAVAQRVIHDQATPSVQRLLAIELLTRAGLAQHDWLLRLLDASQSAEVTSAAVQAIGRADDLELTRRAIARWAQMSLSARRQLLSALVRPKSAEVVIEALEEGLLASTDIDTSLRSTLRAVLPAELRDRLETLLPSPDVDRVQVVAQFAEAARMTGDPSRGGRLFVEHCLTCHRVQAWGQRVGPDLSAIGSRPAAMLLVDLLDPGREIAPDYANFVIETDEGEILTGLLAGETAAAVLLKAAGGTETLVPRERIVRLQPAGASLMPIGFEQKLDLQGVADLLSFLREPKAELLRDGTR
jgi:putative heme-binding domain-containing protein